MRFDEGDSEMKARKVYNYRVVMLKQNGVELDMRGRCSTGQKVCYVTIVQLDTINMAHVQGHRSKVTLITGCVRAIDMVTAFPGYAYVLCMFTASKLIFKKLCEGYELISSIIIKHSILFFLFYSKQIPIAMIKCVTNSRSSK